jgi:polysaccharide export outer membrane protein
MKQVMNNLFSSLRITARRQSWPILVTGALILAPTSALSEYKLQSGDTLEISVTGVPDLRQRAPIGVDGEIALPLVGQIKVKGRSVAEARAEITRSLSNKVFRLNTIDGHEISKLILPEDIVVTAVEYRPIYVNGDVSKPGEYPFRPSMTVRHAITLAAGYDLVQFRVANPFLQAADFRSEYESLSAELATQQARIWRLRKELGEQSVGYAGKKVQIPAELGQRLIQAETEQLNARTADREQDKGNLQDQINKASLQLNVLAQKKKHDEEGNKADMDDFQKVKELFQRGMTPITRLSEARRAALLSADQLLQTIVEMSNIERQRGDYARQLVKIDSQVRIDAWRELQDANLRVAQITAQLTTTGEKLLHTGRLQSQLARGMDGRPEITVYRHDENGDGLERITANEDFELAPGDVVEVTLKTESLDQVPTR